MDNRLHPAAGWLQRQQNIYSEHTPQRNSPSRSRNSSNHQEQNGVQTLLVKFSMPQVQALFHGPGTYVLRITGSFTGDPTRTFEGFETFTVTSPSASH